LTEKMAAMISKRFRRRDLRPKNFKGETKMNEYDYWVVRSSRHNHENKEFDSEAEALEFAQTGDVLAHVVNGCEVLHRPVVK